MPWTRAYRPCDPSDSTPRLSCKVMTWTWSYRPVWVQQPDQPAGAGLELGELHDDGVGTGLRSQITPGDHDDMAPVGRDQRAHDGTGGDHAARDDHCPRHQVVAWRGGVEQPDSPRRGHEARLGGAQPGERDYPAAVRPGGRPGNIYAVGRRGPGPGGPGGQVEDLNGAHRPRRGVAHQRDREQLAVGRQRDALRGLVAHQSGCHLSQVAGFTCIGNSEPEQAEVQAVFGWFLASLDSDDEAAVI